MIAEKFKISLGLTAVGRVLSELEITPQKPLRRAYERDAEAIREWKEKVYPRLKAKAKRSGAKVFFLDEAELHKKDMKRLDTRTLPSVWATRMQQEVFGVERTVLVTWNQPLYEAQRKTLKREIHKRQIRLEEIRKRLNKQTKGKQPTVEGDTKAGSGNPFRPTYEKPLFRKRDCREKTAKALLSFSREGVGSTEKTLLGRNILFTDHWTDHKLKVHAFSCVLALMIVSLMRRKLLQAGLDMSCVHLLDTLSEIQEIDIVSASPEKSKIAMRTVLSATDDLQGRIMKLLGLPRYLAAVKT